MPTLIFAFLGNLTALQSTRVLVARLDCLRASLRDVLSVLRMQDRLALVHQGRWRIKLHRLIQVQVELRELELARDLAHLTVGHLLDQLLLQLSGRLPTEFVNGHRVEHVHGALGEGLVDVDAVLLAR